MEMRAVPSDGGAEVTVEYPDPRSLHPISDPPPDEMEGRHRTVGEPHRKPLQPEPYGDFAFMFLSCVPVIHAFVFSLPEPSH